MQPFPAKNALNLTLTAALLWLHFAGGGTPFVAQGKVSVMIVEETSERTKLTDGQLDAIGSVAPGGLRDYLKTHGEKDPLRVVDKDNSMAQDDAKWQAAFAAKGPSVPWLIVARGGRPLLSQELPKTADEIMRIVKRYGGP